LVVTHRTSPSRPGPYRHVGEAPTSPRSEQSVNKPPASTSDYGGLPERNFCAADEALFAIYQPVSRPAYDLSNPFDRTNISMWIRKFIDKCEDEMVRVERLYRVGLIDRPDYIERTDELAQDLLLHRTAFNRLRDIGRY
jgi:hypothetical protein